MPDPVQPGERYLRSGNPPTTWMVERLIDRPGQPPHVQLVKVGGNRSVTIAASVLADERRFQRLVGR